MMDIVEIFTLPKTDIAVKMWRNRFDLEVGMVSSVMSDYRIELHRLSETEFIFMVSGLNNKEMSSVMEKIREIYDAS